MILAGNILNIIAPIIQIFAFTLKSKLKVLFGVLIASVVWIIAYILLGVPSAAILSCIGAIIPIINYFFEKKDFKKPWWLYAILIVMIVAISIIFYNNIIGLLPSVALFFLVISTIPHKQIIFRLFLILMSLSWLIYGILESQFGIIIGNIIQIIFLIIAIVIFSVKKENSMNEKQNNNHN